MSFCLTELHLWSLKSSLHVGDTDIGTHQYYDKGETASATNYSYFEEKQQLVESRENPWTLKNKRPEKLRDTLKELEELLQNNRWVKTKWKSKYLCHLLLGSGVLVSLSLSGPQLEKVVIDKTLAGKLICDTISDAVLTDSFMILSFLEKTKLCFIQFTKKQGSPDISKRMEKLSTLDLKISYLDLPGPAGRRMERHLSLNCMQDIAVCWWKTASNDAWPWSPISSEWDKANVILLGMAHGSLEVLSYISTEGDALNAGFSINQPYQVHTVEQSVSADKETMADSCIYECARNRIQRLAVTSIPLRSKAISCCRNLAEGKLVLGCEDSSIILYDAHRQVTLITQTELLPTLIDWHPSGAMFLVGSSQGEIQCFDMALSAIKIQLVAEDYAPKVTLQFTKHFDVSSSLKQMQWAASQTMSLSNDSADVHDLLFLLFDKGPLGVLQFKLGAITRGQLGPLELIAQYIHCNQIDEAVNILSSMNWNTMGLQCYLCMCSIVGHLLRQKLNTEREAQLEASLGTFYAPTQPLSDTTILEYRDQVSKYARRFFHHLLRYQRFEKAFLLAVDIGAHDLFMDIHYLALDNGELALAEVAKKKANEIDAESITSGLELLGPLDGEDSLNGAFVDLSHTLQDGERYKDSLPPSGSSNSNRLSQQTSQSNRSSSQRPAAEMRNELGISVYAAALMDDPLAWSRTGNPTESNREEQETGEADPLKVVHFGLV
ncbi:WD repeat-containing and planar cell polarity effector protein fritz homolog [Protopterus annectens]|uniref:WD repeat-containing and planar cell polarity effector protein fritz homolog n=1 Tax=Protopterus annectens TaxID=7888 RepID=UPI001CF99FDC|nr:WD repeat-containing and planar cell polarity effector protein fritz homolog [Protopterus annectens]